MTAAAIERYALPLADELGPKSVLLDFMDPSCARWRLPDLSCPARFDVTKRRPRASYRGAAARQQKLLRRCDDRGCHTTAGHDLPRLARACGRTLRRTRFCD